MAPDLSRLPRPFAPGLPGGYKNHPPPQRDGQSRKAGPVINSSGRVPRIIPGPCAATVKPRRAAGPGFVSAEAKLFPTPALPPTARVCTSRPAEGGQGLPLAPEMFNRDPVPGHTSPHSLPPARGASQSSRLRTFPKPKRAVDLGSAASQVVPLRAPEPAGPSPAAPAPPPPAPSPGTAVCTRRASLSALPLSGVNINQQLRRSRTALKVPLGTILPWLRESGGSHVRETDGEGGRRRTGRTWARIRWLLKARGPRVSRFRAARTTPSQPRTSSPAPPPLNPRTRVGARGGGSRGTAQPAILQLPTSLGGL